MTTFVIGGTGQTGSRVARLLHDGGFPLLIGSRKGTAPEPFKAVRFDWSEPDTFGNPFDADPAIDRIYLVAPTFSNPLPTVKPFFDLAVSKGVKRIVVCGGSAVWKGPSLFGPMLEYICELGIEYTILRPTWFIENLGSLYYESIRKRDEIFSVMEDGRVPFVSVDDIAEEAFKCLTKAESLNGEVFLLGPDLYTCDEMADLLSKAIGRKISHKRLTIDEAAQIWIGFGVEEEYAKELMRLEAKIADGDQESRLRLPNIIVYKRNLKDYIEEHKSLWVL